MVLTVHEQLRMLSRMGTVSFMHGFRLALVALTAGLVAAGAFTRHGWYFAVAAVVALVAISYWRSSVHVRNAARGVTEGRRSPGQVLVTVTEWTDSNSYHATVRGTHGVAWKFEFIPQGWTPREGMVEGELVFVDGVAWPVLFVGREGVLYPRGTPTAVEESR
jgi:hypothetical protein